MTKPYQLSGHHHFRDNIFRIVFDDHNSNTKYQHTLVTWETFLCISEVWAKLWFEKKTVWLKVAYISPVKGRLIFVWANFYFLHHRVLCVKFWLNLIHWKFLNVVDLYLDVSIIFSRKMVWSFIGIILITCNQWVIY